jgi:hypothetical protein
MAIRLAAVLLIVIALPAAAQDVRWINPAGGDWSVGSNWDAGSPPNNTQWAVFEQPTTYTVTGAGPFTMRGMRVVGGDITLDVPGGFGFSEAFIGSSTGPLTRFRLASGTFRHPTYGGAGVEFRNVIAVCDGAPYPGGGYLNILDNADVTFEAGTGSTGNITIASTGTLRASNIAVGAGSFRSFGRLVLDGFSAGASGTTIAGTTNEVMRSRFAGNSLTITGVHDFVDTTFESAGGAAFNGEILLRGPNTAILGLPARIFGGRVLLRDSARPTVQITLEGGNLDIAETCGARRVWVKNGTLRIDGRASVRGPGEYDGVTTGGRIEVLLDGLDLPDTPPIDVAFGPSGTLALELSRGNALRVGDEVPIFHFNRPPSGQFTSVELPMLNGGRQLELIQVDMDMLLRVIPGGSPCWTADFDGDGDVGTDADIEAFFACIGGTCCPACGSPDFDGDGQGGTGADVEAFFRVLAGGTC